MDATPPHQEAVTGDATKQDADQIATLMTEVCEKADAGNETGCMQKVTELKDLMGSK